MKSEKAIERGENPVMKGAQKEGNYMIIGSVSCVYILIVTTIGHLVSCLLRP
jgi:hypothetical protein